MTRKKFDDYEKLSVCSDLILLKFNHSQKRLQILLVQRDDDPFKDMWSLPGGFVNVPDTLEDTLRTKVKEKTGYANLYLEQLYTFDSINRDPRGRVISVAYIGLINDTFCHPLDENHKRTIWANVEIEKDETGYKYEIKIPEEQENSPIILAFDHNQIVQTAIERIINKIWYSKIIYNLLPEEFTLLDAREIFETFLCRKVNNFQRRVQHMVEETGNMKTGQAYRPAKLFKVREENENDFS